MLSNMSLLYVEDDPNIQSEICEILEHSCGQFLTASDGAEGLKLFKEYQPDIVLTDIRMPEMDGLEMSREILKISKETPIVISSAFNDNKYLLEAINIGIKEYLIKPFHLDKLFDKLDHIARQIEDRNHLKETTHLLDQYKKAVDHTTVVSKTDLHGIITYVNEPFVQLSGYSREELLGHSHNILRHKDTPLETFKDMWKTIKSKKIWYGTIYNRSKDGIRHTLKSTITPILNHSGEIVEYLAIREDVTELNQAKELAERSAKLKSEFLANMSHEIRTPMNGILGFTELLSQAQLQPKEQKYLDIINSSTHALMGLINDILDYSKLESGKFKLNYHPINPFDEFDKMSQIFIAKMQEKDIKFALHIDQDIPNALEVDAQRVQQVITNLLSNALKFTPQGGSIDFSIYLLQKNSDSAKIRIGVKDSGIGISTEQQLLIFKAFEQAQTSTSRKFGGTGLGLSISNNLVHLMNSELKVNSKEAEGSHFYFDLDLKISTQDAIKKDINQYVSNKKDLKFSGDILIADDNPVNRILIEELLIPYKVNLTLVENGQEAYEKAQAHHYDLIFMDIKMPVLDGIGALKKIREADISTIIVALTANAMQEDKKRYLKQGFNNYLSKPIVVSELNNILELYMPQNQSKVVVQEKMRGDYINVEEIMHQFSFKRSIVYKLLDMFLKTTESTMQEIQESIKRQDYEHLEASAHFLKGSAGNLRLNSIESLTKEIEKLSKTHEEADYQHIYDKLNKVVLNVREEMQDILAQR